MTIGKPFFKVFILILLLFLLSVSLLSCQKETIDLPFELLTEPDNSQSEQAPLSLYRLILPFSCSAELFSAVKDLGDQLETATDVPTEIIYDTEWQKASEEEKTVDIFVGNCSLPTVSHALSELRSDDYLCQSEETTVILGGKSEAATLAALSRFETELLPYATKYAFPSNTEISYRADYAIAAIKVNGFDLWNYSIVYDESASNGIEKLANVFQKRLERDGKYTLDVCSDKEFQENRKQIYLTQSEELPKESFRVCSTEHGISLAAYDLFGLSLAVENLSERLLTPDADGRISITVGAQETCSYSHASRSILSLKLDTSLSSRTEFSALGDRIKAHNPNLLFLGNGSEEQQKTLANILSNQYSAQENNTLLQAQKIATFLSDLSQEMAVPAKLYQIGEGNEAFLLLVLERFSDAELPAVLQSRTLPLLVLVHTESDAVLDGAPSFANRSFDVLLFKTFRKGALTRAFALYAEPDCFTLFQGDYTEDLCSFSVERRWAFYPNPT